MIIGLILLFFSVKCITTYMLRIMKISHNCIYFASAAVAVDSSHMTGHHLLRGVDSVHLQILLMGTCRLCSS